MNPNASMDHPTTADLSESERTSIRLESFRVAPLEYLQYPFEQKLQVRLAMGALMGLDENSTEIQRSSVVSFVSLHCPEVLANHTNLRHFLMFGHSRAVDVAMWLCHRDLDSWNWERRHGGIPWDKELAFETLKRKPLHYLYLPRYLQKSKQVSLEAITLGLHPGNLSAKSKLLKRKRWLIKAIAINPWVYQSCNSALVDDHDVILEVLRIGDNEFLWQIPRILIHHGHKPDVVLQRVAHHIKPSWECYLSFQAFLTCMTASVCRNQKVPIQLLHCGEETSVALKRLVADFIGVTTDGAEISKMKRSRYALELLLTYYPGQIIEQM